MLVLTRKTRETIKIGDDVTITIVRVKGQTVRVGIDAPRDRRIVRGELPAHDELTGEEPTAPLAERNELESTASGNLSANLPLSERATQVIDFRFRPNGGESRSSTGPLSNMIARKREASTHRPPMTSLGLTGSIVGS